MNSNISIPFEVIERFALKNDISLDGSIKIHDELIDYLDEGQVLKSKDHNPSLLVDEAWHSFILHTKLYNEFCHDRYGHFVHHFPMSKQFDPLSKVKDILLLTENAKCNDGGGDGNCSNKCGQHNCSDTGG